ncbi:hypothetical protein FVB32_00850 [Flagellimonas hymeniacidonis]|uniref:Cardiolipin synthase N-terminal domain-containing protein n=1 Tax=Flagellimonas hymeniacidonis TaxID=2603628 RepID=A0A5C8V650_9FLAO|nr:hypothetical protein [Flagellimonas hymeniacidonis]TXN36866.1 hypothetical protein FVB32_00850 [Flagellimonas hymeniacidonis]
METVITAFLTILALYFGVGLLFGLYFMLLGASKIDSIMRDSKKKVRLLLFPGVVATWPFLLRRLFKSQTAD